MSLSLVDKYKFYFFKPNIILNISVNGKLNLGNGYSIFLKNSHKFNRFSNKFIGKQE